MKPTTFFNTAISLMFVAMMMVSAICRIFRHTHRFSQRETNPGGKFPAGTYLDEFTRNKMKTNHL
jgi:hypothetical protein